MNKLNLGDSTIVSSRSLQICELGDYAIVSDFKFDTYKALVPMFIKPAFKSEWVFHMQVSPVVMNEARLARKNREGEILAYQFTNDISVFGNESVYYGYITTVATEIGGTHSKPKIVMQHVWPRKLYVYLKFYNACYCGDESCAQIIYKDRCQNEQISCLKSVPWNRIYIIMGDLIARDLSHYQKEPRLCSVCAQCVKCSNMITYCRSHRTCKHKTKITDGEGLALVKSKFKECARSRL